MIKSFGPEAVKGVGTSALYGWVSTEFACSTYWSRICRWPEGESSFRDPPQRTNTSCIWARRRNYVFDWSVRLSLTHTVHARVSKICFYAKQTSTTPQASIFLLVVFSIYLYCLKLFYVMWKSSTVILANSPQSRCLSLSFTYLQKIKLLMKIN